MESRLFRILSSLSSVYSGWIIWNLFLAFIPLALSYWLFRRTKNPRTWLWWAIFVVYTAFLPNAPYMLTDVIHLIRGARLGISAWAIALVIIPIHVMAMLAGFEAYVIALINQARYLKWHGAQRFILPAELLFHALCSIGIYLGRFRRFNSWDLVTDPSDVLTSTLDDLTSRWPLVVILVTFIILAVFYWLMKQITLGLMLRIRYARLGQDVLD